MSGIKSNILTKTSKMSDAIRVLQECEQKLVIVLENKPPVQDSAKDILRFFLLNILTIF